MKPSNSSFGLALCISLVLHAGLVVMLLMSDLGMPRVAWEPKPAKAETVVIEPEELPEPEEPEESKPTFKIGEATGDGFASHDAPADMESTAPEADNDQAFLSLDDRGAGGSGADPAEAQAAGAGSTRGQPHMEPTPAAGESVASRQPASLTPLGLSPEFKVPRRLTLAAVAADVVHSGESRRHAGDDEELALTSGVPSQPVTPTAPVAVVTETNSEPSPPAPTVAVADGGFKTNGAQQPSADPARMSDSEVDPFSTLGTAVLIDGEWRVQFGRKVKTRRPRLLLAGMDALIKLNRPEIWLNIDIDATGKVTGVKIAKSSGSNDLDQPTRVAMYDWWFEPRLDKAGNPVPDQVKFRLAWHSTR